MPVYSGDISEIDDNNPIIIRDQLDALIESGDWAAVGATAALLAAASDSQSATTPQSRASRSLSGCSKGSSVDAARAAELDQLVDSGDWEGVVLAAAKFEAAAEATTSSIKSKSSKTNSSYESGGDAIDSASGTGTFTGTFDPSISTSMSDDPMKKAKLAEYRSEVEALVRRVVPEEIDNVDEMMNQFNGREEELIETLRTMQERAVAQKARQVGHKNAKLEARRTVQRGVVPGAGAVAQRVANLEIKDNNNNINQFNEPTIVTAAPSVVVPVNPFDIFTAAIPTTSTDETKPVIVGSLSTKESTGESGDVVNVEKTRTALDMAIEAGDWEAVQNAAAMMSESSVTTASTGEIERLANMNMSTTSSEGGGSRSSHSRKNLHGVIADRASELDNIIDSGDWNAVINVANRFSEEDKQSKTSNISKISREEEDALREAELWMKIAEQKKAEGATDAGASDAAEWAIQRSLSQLREADIKNIDQQQRNKQHDEDEV